MMKYMFALLLATGCAHQEPCPCSTNTIETVYVDMRQVHLDRLDQEKLDKARYQPFVCEDRD